MTSKNTRWAVALTLDVAVNDAVLVQHVDGRGDLLAVQPDDVLLQPQPGNLLQRSLVAVLHEDVHLLLEGAAQGREVHLNTNCTMRGTQSHNMWYTIAQRVVHDRTTRGTQTHNA